MAPVVKKPPANAGRLKRRGFDPWVEKIPRRRAQQPTLVFLPGESHGQRSLAGYSSRSHDRMLLPSLQLRGAGGGRDERESEGR